MKKKLLLIGAGPTSSLIAYNVNKIQSLKDVFEVYVWEKSRGSGGRFSSSRSPNSPNCLADLGAQYLTWSGQPFSKPYFEYLSSQKLIRQFDTSKIPGFRQDAKKANYVCTSGTASIVKHFFEKAGSTVTFNERVDGVTIGDQNNVEITNEKGKKEVFDFVVSTMPVPQLLVLKNIDQLLADKSSLKESLKKVKYTSRYAVGLFYDDKEPPFTKTREAINFIDNDPILRYWSIENKKRSLGDVDGTLGPCSVVVHTSTEYGAQHVEDTPEGLRGSLMESIKMCLPELTELEPAFVKPHKWRYSQVDDAFPGSPGFVALSPHLVAAGDGFSQSGFEGCISSAEATIEYLKRCLE